MRGLNLSSFKKIKEDGKSATMVHKDGHQIVIAKSGLKPIQISQLEKLPIHMFQAGPVGDPGQAPDAQASDDSKDQEPSLTDYIGKALVTNQQAGINPFPVPGPVPPSVMSQQDVKGSLPQPGDQNQQPSSQQAPSPQNPGLPDINAGLNAQIEANKKMAEAQGEQGKQAAQAYSDLNNQISSLPTTQQIMDHHFAEDDAFKQYLNKHDIDPNHFWADKGTGQKVAAGIGLFLGGLGSAFTGQANPALGIINNAIEKDIDAQKANLGKVRTLWSMNREGMKDEVAANLATRNQAYINLQNQLQKISALNTDPIAKARAAQLNSVLENEKAQNNFKRSLISGPTADNEDPSSRVKFLVPEGQQPAAYAKIDSAKYTVQNANKIMAAYDKAAEASHLKDYIPGQHNADIDALHTLLGPTIPALEGSARQGLMDALYSGTTPNPINDTPAGKETKRQALQDYLGSKGGQDSLLDANGIHLSQFPLTNVKGAISSLTKPVERVTAEGKVGLFNPSTKQFIRYK